MAIYSSYRTPYVCGTEAAELPPPLEPIPIPVAPQPKSVKGPAVRTSPVQTAAPAAVLGFAVAAALMVLLLMTMAQLSTMSFEIDALEREIGTLEINREKLLVEHARVYGLDRVEDYAVNELGMVKPAAGQYIYIDAGDVREPTKTAP